ncbi:similar to Saccharomyces cerevisiae YOR274W MOD5 Delta 2-isopentenyl pyrophosphate:tRNA isopentenyl transferase [Maudiozyma saulgeensis]|uniref:tRNA dimethylallyltransferase n=1 Tax=Maudiozyma saulgeensis TaxID=1789683 RepID=A0A1X7R4H5_9SACH|nr:similar to Saccharomyces cerevisiae YOR274W MOD5 Delta 2-isopentenyl pyrophosphate:tRNA isopentenyl transferase [Kazachstania saulgeensis]
MIGRTLYKNTIAAMKQKVIVIAGTTGVGKSQLAVELATRYNGEIINSDAMQVYRDIPIVSNKHPMEERKGIPHHVMDFLPWDKEYYLHQFEIDARNAIDDIVSRGKLPIIVGGTHYYLQFLFDKYVNTNTTDDHSNTSLSEIDQNREVTESEQMILDSRDKSKIFETLQEVDPQIASRYHPNDERRVRRMLEIYFTTGKRPSELFAAQAKQLRYDALFLWLYSDPIPLDTRLDSRVDDMVKMGALAEIDQLYKFYLSQPEHNDHGGVWQVIGFKEFLPWLKDEKSNDKLWDEGVDRMKLHTRQYARRQIKWIQKMLIPDIGGDIYVLNATDLSQWHQLVGDRASDIAANFLDNMKDDDIKGNEKKEMIRAPKELIHLISNEQTIGKKRGISNEDCQHFICDICKDHDGNKLIAIGSKQWETHLKSRRHKGNLTRGSKKAAYEKWKMAQQK